MKKIEESLKGRSVECDKYPREGRVKDDEGASKEGSGDRLKVASSDRRVKATRRRLVEGILKTTRNSLREDSCNNGMRKP